MTWNLSIGADLRRLLARPEDEAMPTAVASLIGEIDESRFEMRADAIAAQIARAAPDLVGLQEVTLLRRQLPGDYVADPGRMNASEPYLDFLAVLQEKLTDRGLTYDVVSRVNNSDVELPADLDAGSVDIRLTDRDVILAREGVETRNPTWHVYEARLTVPLPDGVEFPLIRGYCSVDVVVDGREFTFVNTHLDSVSAATQLDQARELVVELASLDRPLVLVGDFNSPADGSETVTYDLLTQFFTDAYAETNPGESGYTCCQHPHLRNSRSTLNKRLDLVLVRDVGAPLAVERVGLDRDERVSVVVDGERRRLWPSDHVGVVARLQLSPADQREKPDTQRVAEPNAQRIEPNGGQSGVSEVEGTVPMADDTDPESTDIAAPGFGVVTALLALGAVAVGVLRRQRE